MSAIGLARWRKTPTCPASSCEELVLPSLIQCQRYARQGARRCHCDATRVAFADFVPSDLVYRDRVGESYRVRYNPSHRWFYVPEMRADEAVLIKCYDSAEDGTARFTAHSAFEDPTAPADVLPRDSIELRTLVFHAL